MFEYMNAQTIAESREAEENKTFNSTKVDS
jgi:hypothetical protein